MLPLFPSFKKNWLNIFCSELKKKIQLSPSQKLPKAKSTWELKLKPLTAGLPNLRGLFHPKWFHDCNIRKGEYSAHSMVFYLCPPFLLASTGYSTISSLSSQKLLVELKLDCVLTPVLGRKKKSTKYNYTFLLTINQWSDVLKLIQQNTNPKRPHLDNEARVFW